jgi:hypothetical protein
MAKWIELTGSAKDVIRTATSLVQAQKSTLGQREEFERWAAVLREHLVQIEEAEVLSEAATHSVEDEVFQTLSEQLGVSRGHLDELRGTYTSGNVALVFDALDRHLTNFISAGPHGAGKPPRIGKPGRVPKFRLRD